MKPFNTNYIYSFLVVASSLTKKDITRTSSIIAGGAVIPYSQNPTDISHDLNLGDPNSGSTSTGLYL